jgi:hypothetical protein
VDHDGVTFANVAAQVVQGRPVASGPGDVIREHPVELGPVELSHGVLLNGADSHIANALSCHPSLPKMSVWNLDPILSRVDQSATDPNPTHADRGLRQPIWGVRCDGGSLGQIRGAAGSSTGFLVGASGAISLG